MVPCVMVNRATSSSAVLRAVYKHVACHVCLVSDESLHEQLNLALAYPNGALRLAPGSATFSPAMPAGAAVPASAATCGSSAAAACKSDACGSAGSPGFMSVAAWCPGSVVPQPRRHISAKLCSGPSTCSRSWCAPVCGRYLAQPVLQDTPLCPKLQALEHARLEPQTPGSHAARCTTSSHGKWVVQSQCASTLDPGWRCKHRS